MRWVRVPEIVRGVGLRMASGPDVKFGLEIHYANAAWQSDEVDATSVELCVTREVRPFEAAYHVLGSATFWLPPHAQTD